MRNLLALLGLAIVVFGVVGYYKEWYKFDRTPDGQIKLDVDSGKVKKDLTSAEKSVENAVTGKK